jgi:membrane-bound lytic murein transglycosylase A
VTGLSNDNEPIGAQGVPLTPGRSIAVDRLHDYGTPFFIEASLPIENEKPVSPFQRLMIAQDTGWAIVGPARADLYWGAGDDAGRIANRVRNPGRFVMLLPRELDMVAAGNHMPLPLPKPKFAEVEVNARAAGADPRIGSRPSVSPSTTRSVPVPKPVKQVGYQSRAIPVASYSRNWRTRSVTLGWGSVAPR